MTKRQLMDIGNAIKEPLISDLFHAIANNDKELLNRVLKILIKNQEAIGRINRVMERYQTGTVYQLFHVLIDGNDQELCERLDHIQESEPLTIRNEESFLQRVAETVNHGLIRDLLFSILNEDPEKVTRFTEKLEKNNKLLTAIKLLLD
jgi:hypothetical protein